MADNTFAQDKPKKQFSLWKNGDAEKNISFHDTPRSWPRLIKTVQQKTLGDIEMGLTFKAGLFFWAFISISLPLSAEPFSRATNFLPNGDFSQGTQGWILWTKPGTTAELTAQTGFAEIRIDTFGSPWSVGCLHPDLRIEYGRTYEASFEAKAEQTCTLISQLQLNKEPWTAYSKMRSFTLGPKMTRFTYTFTMTSPTDVAAVFQFLFTAPGRVSLAHVSLKAVTQKPLETAPLVLEDRKLDTDINRLTVFVYGQQTLKENNPSICEVKADINDRAVIKWGVNGNRPEDYNFDAVKASHHAGILYMGGMTTVIQKQEFKDEAQFRDMATRDANGELVPWADQGLGIGSDLYRGSLANPRYRKYITDICKIQIDGGADGIHFDEPNSPYLGGPQRNWTNNEGFEDASIADFNRYLLAKYPQYKAADWKREFKMTDGNIIKRNVPPDDLKKNFNYRTYLQNNGWTENRWGGKCVLTPANPLAKEWGRVIGNRMYLSDTFTGTYIPKYYKEIIDELRRYALEKYDKNLLITDNGIMPYADFNSLGIYRPNSDRGDGINDWSGYEYVPVENGRLKGAQSLMEAFKKMNLRSRQTSGNVPLVFFLDFTNQAINDYCALPLEQKKDFWKIYAAEAYAAGCYYAFHLETTDAGPSAQDLGMLDFTKGYAQYYKDHQDLYHHNEYAPDPVTVEEKNISFNLMNQDGSHRLVLHLINHNYNGTIEPRGGFRASVEMDKKPVKVFMVSPDFEGEKVLSFEYDGKAVKIKIPSLKYYDAVVVQR
jgi:hypothetical protein